MSAILAAQDGVISRAQLREVGIGRDHIHAQVVARRWRLFARRVVITHRGPITDRQRCWAALLAAGPRAALCGLTAAVLDGLTGFEPEAVHVVVPRSVRVPQMPGIQVHESRRFSPDDDVHPVRSPPRTRIVRSVVDGAVWSTTPPRAVGILAAAVQQRLVTATQLRGYLGTLGTVRHRGLLVAVLDDIEGGAHSFAELRIGWLCRRAGLPTPQRQVVRLDGDGRRRYLDCYWRDWDLSVEIDGGVHLAAERWRDDLFRQNDLMIDEVRVLRYSSLDLRLRPEKAMEQLARAFKRLPRRPRPAS
ncbi:PDDEXK family nuclease [Frankia nepalensis]|uniref:DUF559 domain-containing protein n=1 Tax=Frankia nepalensis TaxID=1836974 RepID=A0A937RJQ3_9ACTN|nr:hypothetical protein [Frankia nepalensis]MBL7502258.1 hypothetical protein [Frankia nepalensis]MBL7512589.1 hypothetical protein [Frankia nepalensis]MBL7627206.1 hypothetical protein [Frankia nepalensis]